MEQEEYECHSIEEIGIAGALINPKMPHDGPHHIQIDKAQTYKHCPFVPCCCIAIEHPFDVKM